MFEGLKWELGARVSGLFGKNTASNSNVTLEGMVLALKIMNEIPRYTPALKRLGCVEEEAEKFAEILIRAETAGIALTRNNISDIEKVTGASTSDIENALLKWLFSRFLLLEKKMSLTDLEVVNAVHESLYNEGQKNDLDDVSNKIGIPLDVVRNIDSMTDEFLTRWNGQSGASQGSAGDGPKKKPPKTKPITVGDPNASQGSPTP